MVQLFCLFMVNIQFFEWNKSNSGFYYFCYQNVSEYMVCMRLFYGVQLIWGLPLVSWGLQEILPFASSYVLMSLYAWSFLPLQEVKVNIGYHRNMSDTTFFIHVSANIIYSCLLWNNERLDPTLRNALFVIIHTSLFATLTSYFRNKAKVY